MISTFYSIFSFKTKKILKAHSMTHTEYEFKCTQCEKLFRHKRSLEKHMEYHTGAIVKSFVCDVCGKAFRRNPDLLVCNRWNFDILTYFLIKLIWIQHVDLFWNYLQEHRRIHTSEKPYTCEHCASNFRTMSSFYSHLRKIHGKSRCKWCHF